MAMVKGEEDEVEGECKEVYRHDIVYMYMYNLDLCYKICAEKLPNYIY